MRPALAVALFALCALSPEAEAETGKPVRYACAGGTDFTVTFSADADSAVLALPNKPPIKLAIAISGSGFRYLGEGYELRGKGETAWLTPPGGEAVECQARP